jgi:hypothetical protein
MPIWRNLVAAPKTTKTRTKTGVVVKSKFEQRVADNLTSRGLKYTYEKGLAMEYVVPESKHKYIPDFKIRGRKWFLEVKGLLDSSTRKKMLDVKASNPEADIRLLFQRDNPIRKGSKTKYTDWAKTHGFICAVGSVVPEEWLDEE